MLSFLSPPFVSVCPGPGPVLVVSDAIALVSSGAVDCREEPTGIGTVVVTTRLSMGDEEDGLAVNWNRSLEIVVSSVNFLDDVVFMMALREGLVGGADIPVSFLDKALVASGRHSVVDEDHAVIADGMSVAVDTVVVSEVVAPSWRHAT